MTRHVLTGTILAALVTLLVGAAPAAGQTIIHVDDDAPPGGDGQTWQTAYVDLQAALDEAAALAAVEIRMAGGVYKPSKRTTPATPRTETFALINGVALRGGYRGLTPGGDPDDRDIDAFVTILSGDLNGDDLPDWGNRSDNAYHVVIATDLDATTVLDGVSITAGHAPTSVSSRDRGAGMYNVNAGTTMVCCRFSGNYAGYGGGLFCSGEVSPTLIDCAFSGNHAASYGGGMFDASANAVLIQCLFSGNTAVVRAGGMYIGGSSPTLTDCAFSGNTAEYEGGGIYTYTAAPTFIDCTFVANIAALSGGGIHNYYDSDTSLFGCVFSENVSSADGGGVYNQDAEMTLANCVFTGNDANSNGGGMSNARADSTLSNCVFSGNSAAIAGGGLYNLLSHAGVTNCIFWSNTATAGGPSIYEAGDPPKVTYSCIERGWPGTGNIGFDPLFIDADGLDDIPGTIDDDFHLRPESPCINAGDDSSILPDVLYDIDGEERVQQCRVDIGIDETPYMGWDCNDNGVADACDIEEGDSPDCNTNGAPDECEVGGLEDCNQNGITDLCDIFHGTSVDCNRNGGPDECEELPVGLVYVDDRASDGLNDGSDWHDAYLRLADALHHAECTGDISEIRVAGGTYLPVELMEPGAPRTETFRLLNSVAIRGAYRGLAPGGEPDDRDFKAFRSILSGDLAGDDEEALGSRNDNAYHVVTGTHVDATAILDGFTISGGNDDSIFGGGGVLAIEACNATLSNCTFIDNRAYSGGGIQCWDESSPTLINCAFAGNHVTWTGGGMNTAYDSNPMLINCAFSGNSAFHSGGGISNGYACDPRLVNCTFSRNTADRYGSAIANSAPEGLSLTNCIVVNDAGTNGVSLFHGGLVTVTYSCIQDGWYGIGNIDADPLFVDAAGADGVPGTLDDNLHLSENSPCVNAGNDAAITEYVGQDSDGEDRVQRCRVDMGVDESPYMGPDCNSNGVADSCDVDGGTSSDLNTNGIPDECEAGGSEDCNTNGVADLLDIFEGSSADCNQNGIPDECEALPVGVIYVDGRATEGRRDGSSWYHAYENPDDAMSHFDCSDEITEIRVAAGTYTPTLQTVPGFPRTATYKLKEGLALRGGYRGLSDDGNPDDRDFEAFETIFSGEIGEAGDEYDNIYNIVSAIDVDATAVLEGVTIAHATGGGHSSGAMYIELGEPTVTDCVFTENLNCGVRNVQSHPTITRCEFSEIGDDWSGTGMSNVRSSPVVSECRFVGNTGGMYNSEFSSPTVVNCEFVYNGRNGGMSNYNNSNPDVTGCLFWSNWSVSDGGGMANEANSTPKISRCVFRDNVAYDAYGGGLYTEGTNPTVINCLFIGNSADYGGGAIYNSDSSPRLINCTISDNIAGFGGGDGIYCDSQSRPQVDSSIIWDAIRDDYPGATYATFSCVLGGVWGGIDEDPRFVGWGDFRLRPQSPCINTGWPYTETVESIQDLDGHARVLCGRLDMGAYEFGIGDYQCDGDVDLGDYAAWGGCMTSPDGDPYLGSCVSFDFEFDGDVDLLDFAAFQKAFLAP